MISLLTRPADRHPAMVALACIVVACAVANEARGQCGEPTAGDCRTPHETPFCSDATCCELICAFDDFCCEMEWDTVCADEATLVCTPTTPCGQPGSGACDEAHGGIACEDLACCQQVCLADAFCCQTEWDNICVGSAADLCGPDPIGACCAGGACSQVAESECTGFVCRAADHLPPSFTGCYGDADGNGVVNAGDRGFVSAGIGQTAPELICTLDMDGNGTINAGDRGFIAAEIGLCTPLPDWQNGSGLNNGAPDARFGPPAFTAGAACQDVNCPS
jgi:hypothetical protein